jgi:hypothetical protein
MLLRSINSFILFEIETNYLIIGRSVLRIVPIYKKEIKLTIVIIVVYHCYQLHTTYKSPHVDESIGEYQCGFRCN